MKGDCIWLMRCILSGEALTMNVSTISWDRSMSVLGMNSLYCCLPIYLISCGIVKWPRGVLE
ncbi:MAG: hypothetical protein Hyperionvirus25_13 [Hyperionvirus sp.]|uniref:Uncharacterized protein n=1 Tax=Hyperionvirus sp. TaxID=2487770 RepID=A0A3G5AB62_9VIRU|nr:MAG: hypothetical protein Hyperionvirus25_13 [Hyperionvirus sp.]